MDDSKQVVQYLEELAGELTNLQVTTPFHILITGGAYMLLQQKRRSTLDIDFAIIKSPRIVRPKKVFRTMEYILATKIAAYRPKDTDDIQLLIRDLNIHTREQAKAIVDKFLLPDAQEFWEVEEKLEILFP